jgi:hypothetical protein
MSRTTTAGAAPQSKAAQTMPQQSATHASVPMEKVAMRAYQKWLQSGCPHGCDKQHWLEAEAELKSEMTRTGGTTHKR